MTTPCKTILDIHNATVYRGLNKILAQFSLTLKQGENTAILGPNGSGKSTLLKLLTRELMPVVSDSSYCRLFGEDRLTIWDLKQRIGVISHDLQNDYRALATGQDVVLSAYFGSIGLHAHNPITASMLETTQQVLNKLGIEHLAERQYLQLSTGQQRRLLLARALIHQPQVLIFDEPTSGLDLKASADVIRDMRTLTQNGVTLILVTHHIHEIIPEVSRLIFLKEGKIVADGNKPQLLTSCQISDLYDAKITLHKKNDFYQAYPAE